jgi:hypothetical protein
MPIPEIDTSNDYSNSIYKAAQNIREGKKERAYEGYLDAKANELKAKNFPENQNYLRQEKQAELSKKESDAKKAGLDIYTQRLSAIRDVDDFSKGLPYLAKDLEAFGEEGSKELLPRVTYKTDLSGQKQIPDNEAFLKDRDRIVDALSKISGKTKTKPGDKVTWTEDVKDEATGKMKTVDVTKVLQEDGVTWKTVTATHGGIKDTEAKAPKVENIQVGDRNVPSTWDEKKGDFVPIKGAGGPKWSKKDREDKPDMTEPQAREKLFQLAKWESQLEKTGGVDEFLFTMIAKDSPELAKQMQGADKTEAKNFIKEQRDYYRGFLKSGKKAESGATKGTGATHVYVKGKGLVLKDAKGQR